MTKKKDESKELVEQKTGTEVSTDVDYGIADELDSSDCERGRIFILQAGSDLVKHGKGRQGAIVNLADNTELGFKEEQKVDFIIFGFLKYWVETDASSREFIAKYPGNNAEEHPWEEEVGGRLIKRTFHFSYLVLLPSEIEEGIALPYEMAFRSTSLNASKSINGIIKRMRAKQIASWGKVFQLGCVLKTKGKDAWFTPVVNVDRDSTEQEIAAAKEFRAEFARIQTKILNEQQDGYAENVQASAAQDGEEY